MEFCRERVAEAMPTHIPNAPAIDVVTMATLRATVTAR
jgi:hypothetical protein